MKDGREDKSGETRGGEKTIRDGKNDKGTEEITYDRRKGKVREWTE